MPDANRFIQIPPKAIRPIRLRPICSSRMFTAEQPNLKWTGDITYIPTRQGWLYLAVILDVFSRRVIGWAMSTRCDELLVETALRMALVPSRPAPGLLHHTDRGSQYTSQSLSTSAGARRDHREYERQGKLL